MLGRTNAVSGGDSGKLPFRIVDLGVIYTGNNYDILPIGGNTSFGTFFAIDSGSSITISQYKNEQFTSVFNTSYDYGRRWVGYDKNIDTLFIQAGFTYVKNAKYDFKSCGTSGSELSCNFSYANSSTLICPPIGKYVHVVQNGGVKLSTISFSNNTFTANETLLDGGDPIYFKNNGVRYILCRSTGNIYSLDNDRCTLYKKISNPPTISIEAQYQRPGTNVGRLLTDSKCITSKDSQDIFSLPDFDVIGKREIEFPFYPIDACLIGKYYSCSFANGTYGNSVKTSLYVNTEDGSCYPAQYSTRNLIVYKVLSIDDVFYVYMRESGGYNGTPHHIGRIEFL